MSFFSDIFNPTFLMFLGILTIVLGLIIIYFESKLREQNHKISSMLSLVSSLAEEINNVKIGLNNLTIMSAGGNNYPFRQNINNVDILEKIDEEDTTMINVSDDEDDHEDDDDDDDDDDDEDDDEDDDKDDDDADDDDNDNDDDDDDNDDKDDDKDDDEDNHDDVKTVINKEMNNIKILKINIIEEENTEEVNNFEEINDIDYDNENENENENENNEYDEELNELEIVSDTEFDTESDTENEKNSGKNFILFNKQNNNNNFVPIDAIKEINNENLKELLDDHFDLKSINISNLEESKNNEIDYKKIPLTKLKSIVSEKGLSKDPSKLKKHELIKLLELE